MDDSGDPAPPEQRRSVRYALALEATRAEDGQTAFRVGHAGRVLDVSRHGLGLQLGYTLPRATVPVVDLYDEWQHCRGRFRLRVARADRQPNGTWVLGDTFLEPLGEDQLQALLD